MDFLLRLRFSRYRQTPLQSYTSKSPRRSVSVSLLLLIASKYGELGEARIGANAFLSNVFFSFYYIGIVWFKLSLQIYSFYSKLCLFYRFFLPVANNFLLRHQILNSCGLERDFLEEVQTVILWLKCYAKINEYIKSEDLG